MSKYNVELVNAILTILSIIVIANAYHMIMEEGAINFARIGMMGLAGLYLILRYVDDPD